MILIDHSSLNSCIAIVISDMLKLQKQLNFVTEVDNDQR